MVKYGSTMAISFVLDLTQVDSKRSKYVCRLCLCKSLTVKHSFPFRVFLSPSLNHLELLSFLFFLFFGLVQYHCHLIKGNMKCGFNLWVRICTLHRNIMIVWPIKWNFFGAFLNNAADFFSFLFFFLTEDDWYCYKTGNNLLKTNSLRSSVLFVCFL